MCTDNALIYTHGIHIICKCTYTINSYAYICGCVYIGAWCVCTSERAKIFR